jgi:hypothetical protein
VGVSRERVSSLGVDRPHQFLDAPGPDDVDRPAVAEAGVEADKPRQRGVAVIDAEEARPDALRQIYAFDA